MSLNIVYINRKIPKAEFPDNSVGKLFTDDKLVSARDYFEGKVIVEPVYFNQGISGAVNDCMLREQVAHKIKTILPILPIWLTLKVYGGYRTVATQQALYNSYYKVIQEQHPDWNELQLENETKKFVSVPSTDETNPSVHNTGGAVDLTLYNLELAQEVNMGTELDDFSEKAYVDYFEKDDLSREEIEIRNNRRFLYWVMIQAGFTNLPTEWWYYDYGDRFWSYYTGKPERFKGLLNKTG